MICHPVLHNPRAILQEPLAPEMGLYKPLIEITKTTSQPIMAPHSQFHKPLRKQCRVSKNTSPPKADQEGCKFLPGPQKDDQLKATLNSEQEGSLSNMGILTRQVRASQKSALADVLAHKVGKDGPYQHWDCWLLGGGERNVSGGQAQFTKNSMFS